MRFVEESNPFKKDDVSISQDFKAYKKFHPVIPLPLKKNEKHSILFGGSKPEEME
jgi:hypothetical protein